MAVTITIRSVPDDTRDTLAARAARAHMSLQEYLNAELTAMAEKPSPLDAMTTARRRAATFPPLDVDELLSDVDADRH